MLIFDESGPAEVKEFYAPTLEQFREMYDARAAQKMKGQLSLWRSMAKLGAAQRASRRP